MHTREERGFIQFIVAALVLLALIAGVVVALVVGLDKMYGEQTSGDSMFHEDAKINEIKDRVRKKREELKAKFTPDGESVNEEAESGAAAAPSGPETRKSTDERLNDLDSRLKAGAP